MIECFGFLGQNRFYYRLFISFKVSSFINEIILMLLISYSMLTFKLKPFIIFLLLFLVEVGIALWVDDAIVRPFFGDFLAVIALFFLLKTLLNSSDLNLALVSVGFAYFLEFLQYCRILNHLPFRPSKFLVILIGSTFDWRDIFAYTLGIFAVFLFNKETLGLNRVRPHKI